MALKGTSFSVDSAGLDGIVSKILKEENRAKNLTKGKITQATNIMWRIARQKRPMITRAQAKAEGRKKIRGTNKYHRVSDPGAEAGVPVDTGALQASIQKSVEVKRNSVVGRIWTSLFYAKFMEYGTSKIAPRPFMRPAITLTRDAIKAMFAKKENL